jgi:hypothetical protein
MLLEAGYRPETVARMLRAVDGQVEQNLTLALIELGASDCPHCSERIHESNCNHFAAALYRQLWPKHKPKALSQLP